MLTRITRGILLVGLAVMALGASVAAQGPCANGASCVALGSDYFQTLMGTNFNFGGPIGMVDFMGKPIGPGATDTIVQRQADAVINGNAIPIQLVALSLASTAPVDIMGSFFDVFITLNPDIASTGQMMIMGSLAGGTFSSSFNVAFDAHFVPVGVGQPFDIFNEITLSNSGSPWSPTPPPGSLIVSGPFGDQSANMHTGLPSNYVDFWPCWNGTGYQPCVETHFSGPGTHVVIPTSPEPSTFLLLGPAGIGLLWKLRARRSARV